ncbi:MAG: DegT/DnrJ/EryC1/StrS family aminotransferase [Chloroflexi bacterium AL-W]|nr:DegT/DnrJ/EryC1/StrS family aminotransferase [Chloroflexi bacterium AL-N1]NOK67055.1 DegT/DnrJ/EryC1/StrS family aminotransferase [Chloroflexi bacterium AL-N10]NOK74653.1 DegT/DnrJ/EryC1/StrS family aminotransferase [Chloroflexi bacterium AL-N5]NOK81657.1 DegT/DnrJ/EryC1/StrS family aminotransferase [Chloroflexi bacterium AL-W]NOK89127.1 DegT/DnrJ/EryC1/StrS family aminotransferase [Chloroflexi bacterium AL-N15]
MMIPFGDLKRQYETIKVELDAAATRVLAGGWYILGSEVKAFEEVFATFCGTAHAVGVGNGTEALQLALTALGAGPGDEVITVANAGVPGSIAIVQSGARPVYVDVAAHSHNLDPSLLEAAITPRTRAIMPVHLYGRMADMDTILEIATHHHIPVVEDAAQAHGATYHGRMAGSIGACGCFSFYPSKNLGALGDGGAIVTNDAALAHKLCQLREYGWERKYYIADAGGINSRLDALQAALLSVKLRHLDTWNKRRRQLATHYRTLLEHTDLVLPEDTIGHVYHLYVVRTPERDQLRNVLRENGIATDVHYPLPAHQQTTLTQYAPPRGLPITEKLASEILSLPLYPELTEAEVKTVASIVREVQR